MAKQVIRPLPDKGFDKVGAIGHDVLVLARTIDPETGRSVLYGRKLTGLTKRLEGSLYKLTLKFPAPPASY